MKKEIIITALIALVMACIGFYLIDNWKVFVGVFLMLWANNLGSPIPVKLESIAEDVRDLRSAFIAKVKEE